ASRRRGNAPWLQAARGGGGGAGAAQGRLRAGFFVRRRTRSADRREARLASFATEIAYLEEDDWVTLTREKTTFFDAAGRIVERPRRPLQAGSLMVDKGNYRHYMAKEIHEQPEVVGRTLAHYLDLASGTARLPFDL